MEEDLVPQSTGNYSAAALTDVNQMVAKDADDESLNKWKASLGIAPGADGKVDVRVIGFAIISENIEPIVFNISEQSELERLEQVGYTLKEKEDFRIRLTFRVSGNIISGLKYINVTKKMGVKVDRDEQIVGSYAPQDEPHNWMSSISAVPSGMLARGTYTCVTRVTDDDNNEWLTFNQKFVIAKEWA